MKGEKTEEKKFFKKVMDLIEKWSLYIGLFSLHIKQWD